jgi:hypothetical protein
MTLDLKSAAGRDIFFRLVGMRTWWWKASGRGW